MGLMQFKRKTFANPAAQAVWDACVLELCALKPGNVSVYSAAHGMTVEDFLRSAESIAPIMGQANLSLGERIYNSVKATHEAVACNTNLGIVLLCAPLVQAALTIAMNNRHEFWQHVEEALTNSDINDSNHVFAAIRLAQPAGLGKSEQHDVHETAQSTLLDIMSSAQHRDRIAFQYANGYVDIIEALELLQTTARQSKHWQVSYVYLYFLAHFLDTHIVRKHGLMCAQQVQQRANKIWSTITTSYDIEHEQETLLRFDQDLKSRAINPGTSADLTVATLCAYQLLNNNDFAADVLQSQPECIAV